MLLCSTRIFFAQVNDHKPFIEQELQEMTHLPIQIGKVTAVMNGFNVAIVLDDLILLDATNTQPVQKLKEVIVKLNLPKMLINGNYNKAVAITLKGAKLDLIRNLDGNIEIKGLPTSNEPILNLLQGEKYELIESDLSYQDLKNQSPTLSFKQFNLIIHKSGAFREISIFTDLPKQYGDSIKVIAKLAENDMDLNKLQGQIYLEANDFKSALLTDYHLLPELKIQSGSANIKIWSEWKNAQPQHLKAEINAANLGFTSASAKSNQLDAFSANLNWQAGKNGWQVDLSDMMLTMYQHSWEGLKLSLKNNEIGDWIAVIPELDTQLLAYIVPEFIINNEYTDWLTLNPIGTLQNLSFFVDADTQHYAFQGSFNQLGSDISTFLPQIRGLTGKITGSDQQGQIDFASHDLLFDDPTIFRNPLTVKNLKGVVQWQKQAESWLISSRDFVIESPDFKTETDFDLYLAKDPTNSQLDLITHFGEFFDISRLPLYLPAKLMDKDALRWMDQAFIAGQLQQGDIVVHGKLAEFPFDNRNGLFESVFSVTNGELQFHPEWPHVKNLNAEVQYLGKDLKVAINSGEGQNVSIKQLLLSIDSLPIAEHAQLKGQLDSNLQNALQYLHQTPLKDQVDPFTKLVNLESSTQVDLDLIIPFHENQPFGIDLDAHINNASLLFKPLKMPFKQINGILHFTENGISSQHLTGQALGYPIEAKLSTDNQVIRLQVNGTSNMTEMQQQFSFLQNDFAKGDFAYEAELLVPNQASLPLELNITSNLVGLGINSHDFLNKAVEEEKPLNLKFYFENKALVPIKLQYGKELKAALMLDVENNRLYSGHILFGSEELTNPYKYAGLKIDIKLPEFKFSQAIGALNQTETQSNWPQIKEISIDTNDFIWQGHSLGALNCQFKHQEQAWQGSINSPMAKGRLHIPDQKDQNDAIQLDMDYLNLSAMSAINFDVANEKIQSLPLIDIASQKLIWRSVNLGKLKLQTERLNDGMHFKNITLNNTNQSIAFNADWITLPQGSSTLINGNMEMDGFGDMLSKLGLSEDIKETHAAISFTGGWSDTPQQFSLDRLHGKLQIKLSDGRLSSIEPGFGRILGLIAMEQWAKRLSLDFSDIYRQGLAFNSITGIFNIANGIAYTDDLLIDAIAAKMKIGGNANLLDKSLDYTVFVIPKSSDALPIAGTIVDNIASIITQAVNSDYKEGYFFGSEYKATGRWGNVQVTPVNENDGIVNRTWHGLTDFDWIK